MPDDQANDQRCRATRRQRVTRRHVAPLVVLLVAGLVPLPALAAPGDAARLGAQVAELDAELASLAEVRGTLDARADELWLALDRERAQAERLWSQRDGAVAVQTEQLQRLHRLETVAHIDAALAAILDRAGIADGDDDWFVSRFEALGGPPAPPRRADGPAPPVLAGPEGVTPARPAAVTAGRGEPAAGHLQLRFAVRSSLVLAEVQRRIDRTIAAGEAHREILTGDVLPQLSAVNDEQLALLSLRQELAEQLAVAEAGFGAGRPLRLPVDGPVRVSSGFGPRMHPVHGVVRLHAGIDLAAARGTPVVAAASGVVVAAGDRGGYGMTVDLDHGDGYLTRYAHLDAIDVSRGQRVDTGQRLGPVGLTGTTTGPHLHFEIRERGTPIDPAPWLPLP